VEQGQAAAGMHTDHITMVSGSFGARVSATHDGQPVDPRDASVQATISEMQALAREAAQNPKKKRFSFKMKFGR
jgi:hypothetical protein